MQFLHSGLAGPYKHPHLWPGGHTAFRAYGVSYANFLLSAAGCLIEYVHVYTYTKLTGVQPMVTVQCFAHPDPAGWCKRLCSGPVDAQSSAPAASLRKLLLSAAGCLMEYVHVYTHNKSAPAFSHTQCSQNPGPKCGVNTYVWPGGRSASSSSLRRLLRKLCVGCRVFDRICAHFIPYTNLPGVQPMVTTCKMQLLASLTAGGVNTCALARRGPQRLPAPAAPLRSFLLSAAGYSIEYVHVYTPTQIARRSSNGYLAMQLSAFWLRPCRGKHLCSGWWTHSVFQPAASPYTSFLRSAGALESNSYADTLQWARKCGVNAAVTLALWTLASFTLRSFVSF